LIYYVLVTTLRKCRSVRTENNLS